MLNNVVLDVAIGLIFIFLLYSLLASIISEFVATFFAYRHRMLEKAIEQMLDGKNYSYFWWDKLMNIIKWLFTRKKIKDDYKRNALPQTSLKLTDFLSNKTINDNSTDRGKNSPYIKRTKLNKKAALFASKIVNHALYKRKSEQSILFKKPAYLGASAFSDILIDIMGNKELPTGTPILMNDIKRYVETQFENNRDLKDILSLYIEQANGDVQRFKLLIENWYDDTMNRVTGWYKRQATKVLLGIGLLLAMIFGVDTITIVKKLSKDKVAREALVQNASDYIKKTSEASLQEKADTTSSDSLFEKSKKQLERMKNLYKENIEDNSTLLGLGWGDFGYTEDSLSYHKKMVHYVIASEIYNDSIKNNSNYKEDRPDRPGKSSQRKGIGKAWYVIKKSLSSPLLLLGFLITAFAISLGAPFWFDLLNKFVNIRVAGKKPDTSSGTSASKTATLNKVPDPTAKG